MSNDAKLKGDNEWYIPPWSLRAMSQTYLACGRSFSVDCVTGWVLMGTAVWSEQWGTCKCSLKLKESDVSVGNIADGLPSCCPPRCCGLLCSLRISAAISLHPISSSLSASTLQAGSPLWLSTSSCRFNQAAMIRLKKSSPLPIPSTVWEDSPSSIPRAIRSPRRRRLLKDWHTSW